MPEPDNATQSAVLLMRRIVKAFPGVVALDHVDFELQAGEIHALMGENGAGKSTLIKVLTGVYQRDAGEIFLDGQPISARSPRDAQRLGIQTVYQEVNLIPELSVAENIFLGQQPFRAGCIAWGEIKRRAADALERLDIRIDVTQSVNQYSIAIQQMVAIARALGVDDPKQATTRVLVLDEPTSSLDAHEVEQLFQTMRRLKQEGLSILFVSHFLDQVYEISDRMTVLRNGRLVGQYRTAELPRLELIAHMIGKDLDAVREMTSRSGAEKRTERPAPFLRVCGLGKKGAIAPIQFDVGKGEVVGLAGLLGSGRTETARLIFGADRAETGHLAVNGKTIRLSSPRDAIAQGFAFTPEDRQVEGIISDLSVRENIMLALQARRGSLWPLSTSQQNQLADRFIRALNIATPDAEKPVGQLSGGNQQKVILARWLASEPRLLIMDEPTRGIDVGAKAEIEKLIKELCRDGISILFISSELEEVVRDSHRVVILRDRAKVGELEADDISEHAIMTSIAEPSHEQ